MLLMELMQRFLLEDSRQDQLKKLFATVRTKDPTEEHAIFLDQPVPLAQKYNCWLGKLPPLN